MSDTDRPKRCGVGIRGVAMAIDAPVWLLFSFVAAFSVAAVTGQIEATADGYNADLEGPPAGAALLLWLGLSIGYHTLAEWRFGKTAGKHLVAIEAVNDDGSPLSLRSSLVRNVLRIVDWLPGFYLAGIVLLALSGENKRLGDRWGGTVVVRR